MALFFRSKKKTPKQLCEDLRMLVLYPERFAIVPGKDGGKRRLSDDKGEDVADAPIDKRLEALKNALCFDEEKYKPEERNAIGKYLIDVDESGDSRVPLYLCLVEHLGSLEFESRKNVASIINALVLHNLGNFKATLLANECYALRSLLAALVRAHHDSSYAIIAGAVLRDVLSLQEATKYFLCHTELMKPFFELYLVSKDYGVVSDAFITLRDLLSTHKQIVSAHLENHFDSFFDLYNSLLKSTEYFTKRASLKLLSELLLDRQNFNVMIKYISSAENLKLVMMLLRVTAEKIQLEAFHVFKVFVANPYKAAPVHSILYSNKEKILAFLKSMGEKDKQDEQFAEEIDLLIRKLSALGPEPAKLKPKA